MGDATPLSDDERRELEELRAQRRAREEAERARAEREELERLRAEQAKVDAKRDSPLERSKSVQPTVAATRRNDRQEDPRSDQANVTAGRESSQEEPHAVQSSVSTTAAKRPASQEDLRVQAARERGKKLMEPGDDLSMPLGQKLVLLAVFLAVVGFAIAIAFSRT